MNFVGHCLQYWPITVATVFNAQLHNNCTSACKCSYTHTQQFNGLWSGTTRVGQYQKKLSPTHTHPDHRTSFINFLHLLRSIASSVFSLRAWQSSLTTSLHVLFGLPLGLGPSIHTPCISSPNHHHLFAAHAHTNAACSAAISMLCHLHLVSLCSLLGSLFFNLTPHVHLTILISARVSMAKAANIIPQWCWPGLA